MKKASGYPDAFFDVIIIFTNINGRFGRQHSIVIEFVLPYCG
jgi:hypothetical protein